MADAYDEGAAAACHEQGIGVAAVCQGDGVGADDLAQGQLQGGEQVEVVGGLQVVDELHQGFGVGAAAEGDAFLLEPLLDDGVVLDDAVVHQGKVARGRQVRVGVGLRRLAVGGPAGVGNARLSGEVVPCGGAFQFAHFACGLVHVQLSLWGDEGDACAVISSVLQSFQSFYQDGICIPFTYVSYYSTHDMLLYLWVICFVVHSFGHPFELGLGHPSELGLGYPSEWGLGYPSEFPAWW